MHVTMETMTAAPSPCTDCADSDRCGYNLGVYTPPCTDQALWVEAAQARAYAEQEYRYGIGQPAEEAPGIGEIVRVTYPDRPGWVNQTARVTGIPRVNGHPVAHLTRFDGKKGLFGFRWLERVG
jgi:hypothetical protein